MTRYGALTLLCLPLCAQQVVHRYPAGVDAAGNTLTVVQRRLPRRAPDAARCVPAEQYTIEKSRAGRVEASEPAVTLCQTDDQADITVEVGPNAIEVARNGGVQAGYNLTATYRLSPWRTVSVTDCAFFGSGEFTAERWDFDELRAQGWRGTADQAGGICEPGAKLFHYLMVPSVPVDARRLEASGAALGTCALAIDSTGDDGFVIWGKPDAQNPIEVKMLLAGPRTLLAQVIDPRRYSGPASSWVNADHFEIWMSGPDATWQFGVPLDGAPAKVGFGRPPALPATRRWTSKLADGRTATVLSIELPAMPDGHWEGLSVVYSQSLEGRAQKRMIATSPVKRGDPATLGAAGSVLMDNSAGEYIACGVVQGSLDITGGAKRPVDVPRPRGNR